jgi:hypothetical protein
LKHPCRRIEEYQKGLQHWNPLKRMFFNV